MVDRSSFTDSEPCAMEEMRGPGPVIPRLLSINVGLPGDIAWHGQTVHTAVWKRAVAGRRMARRLNLDGDGQGDLIGHGGEHRAVFVYQIESYRYWQRELGRSDFAFGQFGENFTVEGMPDDEVCIGDRYRIGTALFEVTQPRVTCYRVGIRMNEPRMAALLVAHGRPGFYFRVIEEGEVEAGETIVKVSSGAGEMSVARVNALLYLPGHRREDLERALRIPALSAGWKGSFRALLQQAPSANPARGNPGLAPSDISLAPPAWPGFRRVRVAAKTRESDDVISLTLEPADALALATPVPGQFVVLRLQPAVGAAPLMRSYSLSGAPGMARYRLGIQCEEGGAAGTYLDRQASVGDTLEISAPRGSFAPSAGERPVVLASAGIGVTPVLAMLHALAAASSPREVWWLYGARDGKHHPFAQEVRTLLRRLPLGRSRVWYSRARAEDHLGIDFDVHGHVEVKCFDSLGVPREADFYLCGPTAFMHSLTADLIGWGVARARIHTEVFGSGESATPGIVAHHDLPVHPPAGAAGTGPLVSFARSNLAIPWDPKYRTLLEFAEACDVPVRWSCRTGVCHRCESGLVDGAVAYQPDPLESPASGNVLICCSRPRGDVVLDL
jgi:ferredoxin-NADP reductase/MOSC domain-containing protein YiiM/ferredoxin